ncbi:MAG: TonB-dependent receptor [bacterium]
MYRIFLSLLILLPTVVLSQTAQDDTVKTVILDEVVVNAARGGSTLMTLPMAADVVTPLHYNQSRRLSLDDALINLPGILAQSRAGSQDLRITIRGFGARGAGDRSNAGTSRGIRVLIDNFPETEPDGRTSFDLVDLTSTQRIEVIRSNASALWGNASGGLVSISTVPVISEPVLSLQTTAGDYGLQKLSLQTATVLGKGKLYATLMRSSFDGWRANSSSEKTHLSIGIQTPFDERTRLGVFLVGAVSKFFIPGPLSQVQFNSQPEQANPTYLSRLERRENRLGRLGVAFDHQFDPFNEITATVYVNPKFLQRSERGTFRDFNRYHIGGSMLYKNRSLLSAELKNNFTMGWDEAYQDGAILFYSLSPMNDRGTTLRDNKREGANNFGFFVQDDLWWNEFVLFSMGARYDAVTYYSESFINMKLHDTKVFDRITPKIGFMVRLSPSWSIYANIGGGIEVPAGNETDPISTYGKDTVFALNPLLEPIRSTTYEIGIRQVLGFGEQSFVRSLSYDLALYTISLENDIIPYRGGRFYFTAGKTRRTGVEAGMQAKLAYGLSFQAAITYSKNTYISYLVDSVHYSLSKAGRYANYENNEVAGIPGIFYSGKIRLQPEFLPGMFFEGGLQQVGEYFVDDANQVNVPSYTLVNLTIGSTDLIKISRHIGASLHAGVNNLTNQRYAASAFVNPDIVGGVPLYLEPGLPRNFFGGIDIRYLF